MTAAAARPLGVYVHWPFCKSKCPYCDFNSHVRDGVRQERWRNALLAELEYAAREAPDRRVETMFFGGGTPSLMEPATVAALITRGLAEISWDDVTEYAPAVVAAITMPLTYSIATGIGLGFITYAACKILSGRYKEASPAVVILALLFAGKFAVQ